MRNGRGKGVAYEREVAALFERYGFTVRGLEQEGDHLCFARDGIVLAGECKRRERIALPEWWAQTIADAPAGAVPVLTFRPSRTRSRSLLWTDDLLRLVTR
jgi:hypothetical protein